jgi:8-oxo-dGTP pyrophosphatase MutT (NUDIX family)
MIDKSALRDAATVILVRDAGGTPSVLMGQRGANAAFMPSKFVFPGGAVDPEDAHVPMARDPDALTALKLAMRPVTSAAPSPKALLGSAIREVWEETGLRIGRDADSADAVGLGDSWHQFLDTGHLPDPSALRFFFRAVTPPGRPRRFDARFFIAPVEALADDPDDFSKASDELSHLHWVSLAEVRSLDLAFITEVVLAEVSASLPELAVPKRVPFVLNDDTSRIEWL